MANEMDLEILNQGVDAWNDWHKRNSLLFYPDPTGDDIFHGELFASMLSNPGLAEVDIDELNRKKGNGIRGTFFIGDLSGADLSNTNLFGIDFSHTILVGANLDEAKLIGASFFSAHLRGAKLRKAILIKAYLNAARLQEAELNGAVLTKARLNGTDLSKADLSGANLGLADLGNANLREANLREAKLSRANLIGARLNGADLRNADLDRADLGYIKAFGFHKNRFRRPWSSRGNSSTNSVRGRTSLDSANMKMANLYKTDLSGVSLGRADLSEANLSRATLTNARLWGTILVRSDLSKADLRESDLGSANMRNAKLRRANLTGAHFSGTVLAGADLSEAKLPKANLAGEDLSGTFLSKADLRLADLSLAELREANLSGANLEGANLSGTNLSGANLSEANLIHANLVQARINNANLSRSKVYGVNVWDLVGVIKEQTELNIMAEGGTTITVDNIEIAQFIYLLLNNKKVRDVINTITTKTVLILGRFTPSRKQVLDGLRDELRRRDFVPILFDFEPSPRRNLTETIQLLANMSKFVIADITEAKSIPQELSHIIPFLPSVPVQPILLISEKEYAMFEHWRSFKSVLPEFLYRDQEDLLVNLEAKILKPIDNWQKDQNEVSVLQNRIKELEAKLGGSE